MATDIWTHIEYKHRKKKKYVHAEGTETGLRYYAMFWTMAGVRFVPNFEQLYKPKGLPGDITQETLEEYRDGKPDFHTMSWLDTEELKACIDSVREISITRYNESPEKVDEWLQPYTSIYHYMKECDDEGEPARLVFWFDN